MDILNGMRTYVAVVSSGSFTGAAERLGISKALTSKYVGQLEEHLGVRLLNRTTRQLNMTEAGEAYFQRCRQVLDDIDELESAISDQQSTPRGKLKVAAPMTFGELYLARAVASYLEDQPNVSVELALSDRYVNIVDEGFDLAVRIGELPDSSLIARRLAPCRVVTCAAPEYLTRAGIPSHPGDLESHCCIVDTNYRTTDNWSFQDAGNRFTVKVNGRFRVNNAIAVREAMLAGQGIGFCPTYAVGDELRSGKLKLILENYEISESGIYAVYPHNRHLAAKVRTFVDFLVKKFGAAPEWDTF
jgi:DNA-binding transcriptional LysR family regulator